MAKSKELVEVTVKIPKGTYGKLLLTSEDEGVTVDEIVTEAVENELEPEDDPEDNPE